MLKKRKQPPLKEFGWRNCEVVAVNRPEKPFEFPISAEKNRLKFSEDLFFVSFFFGDHLFWGRKNRLNFGETV